MYVASQRGLRVFSGTTVRLDFENEVQPDVAIVAQAPGGPAVGRYVEGAPPLIIEISVPSASIDLHLKKRVYQRNGIQEYLVWRTMDGIVDWFVLEGGEYVALEPGPDGVIESRVFPGLRLPVGALLDGDRATVLAAVSPR